MITIGKITDQILRLYSGGDPSDDKEYGRSDIKILVGQATNKLLKQEHAATNMAQGEMFPPHTLISTYKVPVNDKDSDRPYDWIKLPVFPISLPRNMGVWGISDISCSTEYIPLENGQFKFVSSQEQLKYLEGQVGYWVEGRVIYFSEAISDAPHNVSSVRVQLLIVDPEVLGEYDYLPIPKDLEDAIIKEVLTTLGALPKTSDKVSDSNNVK